jgi:hypothetical protein
MGHMEVTIIVAPFEIHRAAQKLGRQKTVKGVKVKSGLAKQSNCNE